jgi:hypothetical protein
MVSISVVIKKHPLAKGCCSQKRSIFHTVIY